jgi:hypothetical protein
MQYPAYVVVYQGRRYRPGNYDDKMIEVDPADLARGFVVHRPGIYFKAVPRTEVDEAYRILCYGVYRGVTVPVIEQRDAKFLIECDHRFTGDGWHWQGHGFWVNGLAPMN